MVAPKQKIESIKIFFSYAKEDATLRDKLAVHLKNLQRQQVITAWHDNEISAGSDSVQEIETHLNSAHIILLLISADFMASEDLWERDVKRAMERHKDGDTRVIPILLRDCDWQGAPFSNLQPLPRNQQAIKTWSDEDTAFTEVVQDIRKAIQNLTGQSQEVKDFIPEKFTPAEVSIPITKKSWQKLIPWHSLRTVFGASTGVTLLIVLMRFFGLIQVSELWLLDHLIRLQPAEPRDSRLLIVQITPDDINKYRDKQGASLPGASLPDKTISALLLQLLKSNPRVIALDLYREFDAEDLTLKHILSKEARLIATCKVEDTFLNSKGTSPPPELINKEERIGFSDFLQDEDGFLRRQLLQKDTEDFKSDCRAPKQGIMDSFSFKVAQHYLSAEQKQYKNNNNQIGNLTSGNVVLESLYGAKTGGYNATSVDFRGDQILLNYRSVCSNEQPTLPACSPQKLARTRTVREVLESKVNPSEIKDKIILIGTNNIEGVDTLFITPFKEPQMPGLIVQAQMVSQLVSAVKDNRPLLKVWPVGYEILWIFAWGLGGAILAQFCRSKRLFIILGGVIFASLYISCWILFIPPMKIWIPFIPPAATFLMTGGVVILIRFRSKLSS